MTIKSLREASGMTQKAFAEYFGIPKRTVENWEGGKNKCPSYLLDLMEYKLRNEGINKTLDGAPTAAIIDYLKNW
jgi:DNA-binding transcriptional regulator YiaG